MLRAKRSFFYVGCVQMSKFVKRTILFSAAVLQCLLLFSAVQRTAHAYVDPGSGLLALQFLSSILGGGIFFLRKRLRQIFFPAKCARGDAQDHGVQL